MKFRIFSVFVVLSLVAALIINFYSYIFSRTVTGEVFAVERVTQPTTVIGNPGQMSEAQLYSFAVAIKDKNGEIITASTEDRQWAVVQKCLDEYEARLEQLLDEHPDGVIFRSLPGAGTVMALLPSSSCG